MAVTLVLDIECVPDSGVLADPVSRAYLEVQAKKREWTVEQYCQLCPPLAQVYCVGFARDAARVEVWYDAGDYGISAASPDGACNDEQHLLTIVAELFETEAPEHLITYNGRGYDLLVLWHRMKRHGVTCPPILTRALRERRWDHHYSIDLQDVVTFDGLGGRFPLATYALGHRLHFSKGEDVDGANLLAALQEGKVDEVLRYNAGDVECTRQLYLHLTQKQALSGGEPF